MPTARRQHHLRRGDDLLADITPDFIKIDVEGMEMSVLSGLSGTVARCRPTFFVEVDNVNRDAFLQWVETNSYAVRARFRRYRANENFLIVPRRTRSAEATPASEPADDMADDHADAPAPPEPQAQDRAKAPKSTAKSKTSR